MSFLASVPLETADCASSQISITLRDGFAPTADFHDGVATRPRTLVSSRLIASFVRQIGRQTGRRRYIYPSTRILIDYVARARDELENYAKSEDALGESPVDRPRRFEIVGDPRTMSIVPAIL